MQQKHIENWALDRIVELDLTTPGLAGHFLRASDERRHVIAAFLAMVKPNTLDPWSVGDLLMSGRHDAILSAGFDSVPSGYRAALRRTDRTIQPQRFYRYLAVLLSSARRADTIVTQQPALTMDRIKIARRLPPQLRSAQFIALHHDIDQAKETTTLFTLLNANGIDAEALAASLTTAETRRQLSACWQRWAERTRFPSPPLAACDRYTPIQDAVALKRLAREYRNCSRQYLTDVLDGDDAFGVYAGKAGEVVVHLRRKEEKWWYKDCHARANRRVRSDVRDEVEAFLEKRGFARFAAKSRANAKWEPLRKALGRWDYGHDEVGWG